MSAKITLDEFIKRSKRHHGDSYDYSNVVYVDAQTKVQIYCKKHNYTFWQRPASHSTGGYCCPECVAEVKRGYFQHSKELAMSKLPSDVLEKYDFSETKYNGYHSKAIVRCKKHNIYFSVVWMCLYQKSGCPECSKEKARKLYSKTTSEFVQEAKAIFGATYNYDKVTYINGKEKVIINCRKHGDFLKTPQKHLAGQGCPKCKSSRGETAIQKVLDKYGVQYMREWNTPECRDTIALRFDFRVDLVDKFFLIEYDGKQHFEQNPDWAKDKHSLLKNVKRRDAIKSTYCRDNCIPLLRIPYWDFPNIENIVTAFIKEQQNGQTEQETT
jgi:Zn finger protein HypA/HybF involved in hydrogenase expression